MLVRRDANGTEVLDFAVEVTEMVDDGQGGQVEATFFRLASGSDVVDSNGNPILTPSLAELLAQATGDPELTWELLTGAELDYIERYFGENIPIDTLDGLETGAISALSSLLEQAHHLMDLQAIRLAMQGPLAPYFDGIEYDPVDDHFRATTDRQLTPMLEAVFAAAPIDAQGAEDWLVSWTPLINTMLADYDRGGSHLLISQPFFFTHIVAAYENIGLPVNFETAAIALGMPQAMMNIGSGVRDGTTDYDLYYMSTGNDTARGAQGADVYVFGQNFGSDVIEDYQQTGDSYDTIRFAHLTANDVTLTREGIDLVITETGTSNTIRVVNNFHDLSPNLFGGFDSPDEAVEEIVFADGTVWTAIDIAQAVSHPEATDDVLEGTDQVDFLDGGAGNDVLRGGNNLDFYAFDVGYGNDVIEEFSEHALILQNDIVTFGAGITRDTVIYSRTGNSDDLVIGVDGAADTLTISGQFDVMYPGLLDPVWFHRIESFSFTDGTFQSWEEVADIILDQLSTAGDDTIYGFAKEDRLDGGAGNDYLSGGNENDSYLFGRGYGADTIEENQDNLLSGGDDTVVFASDIAVGDVTYSRIGNSDDLVISLAGDPATLTITDQFHSQYTGVYGQQWWDRIETFSFQDGSGISYSLDDVSQILLDQGKTVGDDTIYGFDREDTLDGGAGNDFLSGGNENDVYVFGHGYDNDTIDEQRGNILSGGLDVVRFNADVATGDIILERGVDRDDLIIRLAGTLDSLTIVDTFRMAVLAATIDYVEEFHFDDQTVWTLEDVRLSMLAGAKTSGDDLVLGFGTNDVLDGGAGNDLLEGSAGSDEYVYNIGYGHDVIFEDDFPGYSSNDAVIFGAGITPGDVVVTQEGNDLRFSLNPSGETLTVRDFFVSSDHEVEEFRFADTTVWTRTEIDALLLAGGSPNVISGTTGDDVLHGTTSSEILDGGLGNDVLDGNEGGDIYEYTSGDGSDTITESNDSGLDRLKFTDLTAADVTVSRVSTSTLNLQIAVNATGHVITIPQQFSLSGIQQYGIEQIIFSDGEIWDKAAIVDNAWFLGTAAGETINGRETNDTLVGFSGNDTLFGNQGSDTYRYASGDGNDIIDDQNDVGTDRLVFTDLNLADVTFAISGANTKDLIITVNSTGGTITVDDQFYGPLNGLEQVVFADGTTWDRNDILYAVRHIGTTGNDTMIGGTSDEAFEGGLGDDTLKGAYLSDTYFYNVGDGNDVIYDSGFSSDIDRLVLGAGLKEVAPIV